MKRFVSLCLPMVLCAPVLAEAPLKPGDFAYGAPVVAAAEASIYEFSVPVGVYEAATRADLGDMRVFNGGDEVVSHALRRAKTAEAVAQWSALTLFPVRGTREGAGDELNLRIERNRDGTLVQVRSAAPVAANAPVSLYVSEVRETKKAMRALEVDWKDPPGEGYAGRLSVEASDDLKSWRSVASDAPVMRLSQLGEKLDRRQVNVGSLKTKYLRLRWAGPIGEAPVIAGLRAEFVADGAAPTREWKALPRATAGEKAGEFLYTLDGRMPVDRVRIRLPQANTVVNAELFNRAERGEPWVRRTGGLAYRVARGGVDVVQDDFTVSLASGAREWKLVLSSKDGAPGAEPPTLEMGWLPHTVVFSARGKAPFQLAYGKAGLAPGDASLERLFSVEREGEPKFVAQAATLGTARELGGEARRELSLGDRNWRTWILWAVLGLGVALLGWMAANLAKQMKSSEPK